MGAGKPEAISKRVLERGLDEGTAFEILSIDIADVDIGRNVGAELQTDQADADKKIAQAQAEQRRAMAVAEEQEMRARGGSRSSSSSCAVRGVALRQSRCNGSIPNAERAGRHPDA